MQPFQGKIEFSLIFFFQKGLYQLFDFHTHLHTGKYVNLEYTPK